MWALSLTDSGGGTALACSISSALLTPPQVLTVSLSSDILFFPSSAQRRSVWWSVLQPRCSAFLFHTPETKRKQKLHHQTSNIKHQTSNIKHQSSNIKHQSSNIKHQTSDIKHQTSGTKRDSTLRRSLIENKRGTEEKRSGNQSHFIQSQTRNRHETLHTPF